MADRTDAQAGVFSGKPVAAGADMPMRLSGLERLYRQSGLFGWQLKGRQRDSLRPGLQDPWQGNAHRGADIMAYRTAPAASDTAHAGFAWLRDLRAEGGVEARSRARDLITEWIDANQAWRLPDWRPDLMGERLAVIAMNYGWYGDSADEAFQSRLAHTVEMQLRCLAMDWRRMRSINQQIGALRGLALAEAALGGSDGSVPIRVCLSSSSDAISQKSVHVPQS